MWVEGAESERGGERGGERGEREREREKGRESWFEVGISTSQEATLHKVKCQQ